LQLFQGDGRQLDAALGFSLINRVLAHGQDGVPLS
jgi:hypothetical protein